MDLGLSRTELTNLIDEWIFNERNRKILKRRLIDGVCYEPLAEEFDLSVRQVKKIVAVSKATIMFHIKADE